MPTLILLALEASIVLIEFSLGLKTDAHDVTYMFHRPGQLLRSLLSMYIVMPSFALLLAIAFHFHPPLEIALITLAVSPVPPLLPKKVLKAGGRPSHMFGLLVAAALFAIVFIPFALEVLARAYGMPIRMSLGAVASLVLANILAPIGAGIAGRVIAPDFADRIAGPLSLLATLLLVVGIVPIIFIAWPAILFLIGNGTIVAIVAFICLRPSALLSEKITTSSDQFRRLPGTKRLVARREL